MRDAFGGISMIRILLVFIIVLVGFTAISLNYAKAFRVKNKVMDFIEQREIQDVKYLNLEEGSKECQKLDSIVEAASYNIECNKDVYRDDTGKIIAKCYKGITIAKRDVPGDQKHIYYDVITYGGWNLPALNMILSLGNKSQDSEEIIVNNTGWKVVGEVKVVKQK